MKRIIFLALFSLWAVPAAAQAPSASPVADAVRARLVRMSRNLVAAADDMPVGKFQFKPTPAQLSFADVILHLSGGNVFLCSGISGTAAPAEARVAKADSAPPAELTARLKRSFDYCTTALAKVDDSKLAEEIPWFGGPNAKSTRGNALVELPVDWQDHYSQLAIYLRINGILPPTARPRPPAK